MAVSAPSAVKAGAVARLALTETLLLKVGQVVQATVVGKTAGGLTALKIGDQIVQAQLPVSLPNGTSLQLAVKAGGATPQLVVVSQTPPGQATVTLPKTLVVPLPAPAAAMTAERLAANGESVPRVTVTGLQGESGVVASAPVVGARGLADVSVRTPVVQAPALIAPGEANAATVPAATSNTRPVPIATVVRGTQVASAAASATSQPTVQFAQGVTAPGQPPAGAADVAAPATTAGVAPGPAQAVAGHPGEGGAPQLANAAAQGVPRSVPTTATTVPNSAEAEVQTSNPLLLAQSAARSQVTMADLPRAVAPPVVQSAQAAAPPPATVQAALAQMMPEAMAKQNSTGPLLASLAAVMGKAGVLPEPVLRAALGVLAQRIIVTNGRIIAADLEQAVAKSGIYLEAALARGAPEPGDAKAALLNLRGALARLLGETPAPVAVRDTAPPPLKGLPLRAPMPGVTELPDGPRDLARALHGQTDAAVSRVKLMQMASLPDGDVVRPANQSFRMELPFLIGHELVMAQIQITRDAARREADRKRGWTMRFALNFSATGEVGAEVGLLGTAVNVSLWAAEPETAVAMNAALPELGEALAALGLMPGAIRIRHGAPEPEKPASGRLLDSVS